NAGCIRSEEHLVKARDEVSWLATRTRTVGGMDNDPLAMFKQLPWYAYAMLGVMLISFIVVRVLPMLRTAKRVVQAVSGKMFRTNPKSASLSEAQFRGLCVGAIGAEQQSHFID